MEYAKDEIFQIRYNANLNRLQIGKERVFRRLLKTLKRHRFISTVIMTLITFSTFNMIMIFNFMKILQTM